MWDRLRFENWVTLPTKLSFPLDLYRVFLEVSLHVGVGAVERVAEEEIVGLDVYVADL